MADASNKPQFDCGHFKEANTWLRQKYGPDGEINWNLGPAAVKKAVPTAAADDEFPFDEDIPAEEDLLTGSGKKASSKKTGATVNGITEEEEEALSQAQEDSAASENANKDSPTGGQAGSPVEEKATVKE
jgi:uracil-DNA glycosylase